MEKSKIRNTGLYPCAGKGLHSYSEGPHWHGSLQARKACMNYERRNNPVLFKTNIVGGK